MKKAFTIFSIFGILIFGMFKVFGDYTSDLTKCSGEEGFAKYECAKEKLCKDEKYGKFENKIVVLEKTYEKNYDFEKAKKLHSDHQNQIYKCGILESQRKVYKELIDKLVKTTDKTGILKSKILPKIKQKLSKIDTIKSQNKCNSIDKNSIKDDILGQTFLEVCHYNFFLLYLNDKGEENIDLSMLEGEESIGFKKAEKSMQEKAKQINHSQSKAGKQNSTAFKTYTQYDDFLKTHIMLELIREDYANFRDSLYQMLHPVNQTVYKVINAQNP